MKSAYTSMVEALTPLSIYEFENTNVGYELLSYSLVLDEINEKLTKLLDECFIESASDYGLENRELIIGAVRNDLSVDKRRSMLKLRESITSSSFTLSEIKKSLESFGLQSKIYEYPSLYIVVIDAIGSYSTELQAWIRSQVEKIMPAHLQVQVVFGGPTWEQSDTKDNTFSYIDSMGLTWGDIDNIQ